MHESDHQRRPRCCRFTGILVLAGILLTATCLGQPAQKRPSRQVAKTKYAVANARLRIDSSKERLVGGLLGFSPDASILVSRCGYRTHLWDAATGKHLRELLPSPYGGSRFTQDGRMILAHTNERTLSLWEVSSGKKIRDVYSYSTNPGMALGSFVPSPDWSQAVAVTYKSGGWKTDKEHLDDRPRLHLYNFKQGKLVHSFERAAFRGHFTGAYTSLAWAPDSNTFAAADRNGTIVLWNPATGKILREIPIPEKTWEVTGVTFTPDSKYLISCEAPNSTQAHWGGSDVPGESLRIREVATGKERFAIPGSFGRPRLSPDGRTMVTVGTVWEFATGQKLLEFEDTEEAACQSVAIAPNGKALAAAMYHLHKHYVLIWDWEMKPADWGPPKAPLSAEQMTALWQQLADHDATKAYRAILTLSSQRGRSVAILKERLAPVPAATSKRIQELVAELDDDDFKQREAANKELLRLGPQAESALRDALKRRPSAELRRRVEPLVAKLDQCAVTDPEVLRAIRAIWVLQRIASPEARVLLEKLAAGATAARQTQEAKAALHFLDGIKKGRQDKNKK